MPKSDVLKRIDESIAGMSLTDVDVFDPTETSTPPVPSGITVTAVQDGILVNVDFLVDRAHLHERFQSFIAYGRPYDTEIVDGTGHELGRFSDSDWVWQPPEGGYQGWEIALSAISNTGYESGMSAWYRCVVSTFHDDFSGYGGDEVSDVDSLYWLSIEQFERAADWLAPPTANMTSGQFVEGKQGLTWTITPSPFQDRKAVALDLSNDSRFTDDDYVAVYAYVTGLANIDFLEICFATGTSDYYYAQIHGLVSNGANYLEILRGDFGTTGSPDWSDINYIMVRHATLSGTATVTFDDWRIVKADPDDADVSNDTGRAWDFTNGTWRVVPGLRPGEPFHAFSLAQFESTEDDDFFAVVQNVEMPNNQVSAGLLLPDGGRAGLIFRLEDDTIGSEDCFNVEIYTATDTLMLVRYTAGVRSTLASVTYAAPLLTWLGVDFRDRDGEGRILIYAAGSQWDLFTASALRISHATEAAWPDGRGVGLVTHAANARFVEFRAGSPQTADYAHRAGHALTAGMAVEDYGAAVARRANLPATAGVWSMASVQRSTGNVYDSSGQGRTLTYHGDPAFDWLDNGTPYLELDGSGDYLSRTDETDMDVLGTEPVVASARRGLTLMAWCRPTTANLEQVVGKWLATGNQRAYRIANNSGTWLAQVSGDGTATTNRAGGTATTGQWHFLAVRLVPSTSLDLWCGTGGTLTKYTNTTSIPASIVNSTADFQVGAEGAGGNPFAGREGLISLHFCALDDGMIEKTFQGERALYGA